MTRNAMLVVLVALAPMACKPKPPANQPEAPALRALRPPPTNVPLTQPRDTSGPQQPRLAQGTEPAVVVLRGGRPFHGTATVTGRLSVTSDRVRVSPASADSAIELLYRLPPGVAALPADTGTATLAVVERSGPAGADQLVLLRTARRTLLGVAWRRGAEPLTLDLGNGLRLVQQGAREAGPGYSEAPLRAVGAGSEAPVPLGRVTAFGGMTVYAEVSHLFTAGPGDAGQVGSGYILKAWAVSGPQR